MVSGAPVPLLEVRGIAKAFPGVRALDGVSLQVRSGEVLALIGENGAGKSTLMKVLAGIHQPDAGTLLVDGAVRTFRGPGEALAAGIALIHQELSLCDNLTVAGALFLGRELRRGPWLRERGMEREAVAVLERVGLDVDPRRVTGTLAPGQKQLVEIARALLCNARVLIMDEPTSSLTQAETERLFRVVRELRDRGCGIVHITHRMAEVIEHADRVVALRDGANAGELGRAEVTHERMVAMMVGRQLSGVRRVAHAPGPVVLAVEGLCTSAHPDCANTLAVRAGEVVGIAGLLGSGRSELLRAIFGADRARRGMVRCGTTVLEGHGPAEAAAAGLVLVPEDRKLQGLVLSMTVRENLSLPTLRRQGVLVDRAHEEQLCARMVQQLRIATPHGEQVTGVLSGGNQQKVALGKWLAAEPRVLMLDEPTRGVDVGARAEIYEQLHQLAGAGLAVLFVSSELDEVLRLADRVLVMHEGVLRGELDRSSMSEQAILSLATGRDVA